MTRRTRPPRQFVYHIEDPYGNRMSYITADYFLKNLIKKHEMVVKALEKEGFRLIKRGGDSK